MAMELMLRKRQVLPFLSGDMKGGDENGCRNNNDRYNHQHDRKCHHDDCNDQNAQEPKGRALALLPFGGVLVYCHYTTKEEAMDKLQLILSLVQCIASLATLAVVLGLRKDHKQ